MNFQAFLRGLWLASGQPHHSGHGDHHGSNRHNTRQGHAPTPGYKLARRFWPGLDRGQILARLSDLATLAGRRTIRRAK